LRSKLWGVIAESSTAKSTSPIVQNARHPTVATGRGALIDGGNVH
jgi:hypothetical protein